MRIEARKKSFFILNNNNKKLTRRFCCFICWQICRCLHRHRRCRSHVRFIWLISPHWIFAHIKIEMSQCWQQCLPRRSYPLTLLNSFSVRSFLLCRRRRRLPNSSCLYSFEILVNSFQPISIDLHWLSPILNMNNSHNQLQLVSKPPATDTFYVKEWKIEWIRGRQRMKLKRFCTHIRICTSERERELNVMSLLIYVYISQSHTVRADRSVRYQIIGN